jgi:hypothetical protein
MMFITLFRVWEFPEIVYGQPMTGIMRELRTGPSIA